MSIEIIIALISGLCAAIPSYLATRAANNRNYALMEYQIKELRKDVEKHNNLVERMALAERELSTMWKRIDELKKENNDCKENKK